MCARSSAVRSRCTSVYERIAGKASSSAVKTWRTREAPLRETRVYSWSARCGRSSYCWWSSSGRGSGSRARRSAAARASGAQASAPSGFAYSPSGPKAAPPTRTGTPIAWQAVIAACAVGSRVGIELESATASASVLCRWTIRCGVGICAPR